MAKRKNFWEVSLTPKKDPTKAKAMLLAYHKFFEDSNFRFMLSTGVEVEAGKRQSLQQIQDLINEQMEKEKPKFEKSVAEWGKRIRPFRDRAAKAFDDLQAEGRAVTNKSLKFRIELMRDGFKWNEESNELQIWDGVKVEYFKDLITLRGSLDKQLKQESAKQKPDFRRAIETVTTNGQNALFGFWDGILKGTIKPRHGKALRPSSAGVKRQSLRTVKEYDPLATFERMDMTWYNGFVHWMEDQTVAVKLPDGKTEIRKRFDVNTVGKHIRQLKSVLHLAYRNELMSHDKFKYWVVTKESNEVVTLSKDELLKIHGKAITGTKEDVKDIFVMACFLGPRISDFKALNKSNLSTQAGIDFFEYTQEKTGARCRIPVPMKDKNGKDTVVKEILDKRAGEFPRMISEQNFRAYLKEICKEAELNDRVIVKIRDGKPQYKKKWEAISPHSARRTFASALFYGWFGRAMPASFCMRYTGHKTEKSFMLYIGASEADLDAKALEYFDLQPQTQMKAS